MRGPKTVLIVDDEAFVRASLAELLENEGYRAVTADSAAAALQVLSAESVDVIVTDLKMPSADGLELLEQARRRAPDVPVILLTGVGTVPDAVRAMKAGAYDCLEKPVEPAQFFRVIERAIEHRNLVSEVRYLREEVRALREPMEMVGSSRALSEVRALISRVARTNLTVLVTGESGTGKDLVAAEIHRQSDRRGRNLVNVNCAAIPEPLFESEFFGHRRGAFTTALSDRVGRCAEADGGTLVLDEVGTLKAEMQAKLLRFIETGEYQVIGESRTRTADVRIIAITNEDLEARVRSGAFRRDLYYRLNVFPIRVPPLRDRKDDIPALAVHFARRALGAKQPPEGGASLFADDAFRELQGYDWPGNVRELKNVVERAVILSGGNQMGGALFRKILGTSLLLEPGPGDPGDLHLRRRIESLERSLIAEALERVGGRKGEAAALLGVDPKNFSYYLRKHGFSATGGEEGSP